MYLSSLKVQHYKSLDNVTVDFAPDVTVIVGPNGVGKSNFVDVLRFLRDASNDMEHAVSHRGGIGRLLQNHSDPSNRHPIDVESQFAQTDTQIPVADLALRLVPVGDSDYEWDSEWEQVATAPGWSFCNIYPNTLKKPALPDRENALMESGDNWASVIKALQRSPQGRSALESIYDSMRAVMPTFEDVNIQTVGSYLVPLFNFRHKDGSAPTSFDPVQLSDGTLRLFGILLAAYQLPRPQLLVIEEPEQTIYPGALGVLADVFKEVGRTTQVIITTHNPHLVNYFAPEQIRVATMHHGLTRIGPIHPHQMEAVHEGLISLEEFMGAEGLRPDDTQPLVP